MLTVPKQRGLLLMESFPTHADHQVCPLAWSVLRHHSSRPFSYSLFSSANSCRLSLSKERRLPSLWQTVPSGQRFGVAAS
jgi:hypothetical protein